MTESYLKEEYNDLCKSTMTQMIYWLRYLEKESPNAGKDQLWELLEDNLITIELYKSILPTLNNLDMPFKINLIESQQVKK